MSEWTDGRTDGRTNGRPDVGCTWTAFCGGFLHCQCCCFLSPPPSSVDTPGGCWCLSDAVFLPLKLLSLQIATSISIASFFVFVKKKPWCLVSLQFVIQCWEFPLYSIHTHTHTHLIFIQRLKLVTFWQSAGVHQDIWSRSQTSQSSVLYLFIPLMIFNQFSSSSSGRLTLTPAKGTSFIHFCLIWCVSHKAALNWERSRHVAAPSCTSWVGVCSSSFCGGTERFKWSIIN